MTLKASEHVDPADLVAHGLTGGQTPQTGSITQLMGSRETAVYDGHRWISQNDDLGRKLDALLAGQAELIAESRRANEFLERIARILA